MSKDRFGGRLPAFGIMAPLVLVLGTAVALAWLALDATSTRREAAERTVTDFADFAAFIIANTAQQELERRLLYAFGPLRRYDPSAGEPLPPPSVVGQDRFEAQRCAESGIANPSFIRLDLTTGELVVDGAPIAAADQTWLADTLALEVRNTFKTGWSFAHLFADNRGLGLLAWTVLADARTEPLAVYAKSSCLAIDGTSLFAIAARTATVLPPSLTGGLPNDSLITLLAEDPHGHAIYESPTPWPTSVNGRTGPLAQLGGARVVVDIRQEVAERLVIGGIPYGGAPMALLLVLLIIVFTVFAVLQLRKQQALVTARESFISNVSHELRTPLQQILVFAELLRMEKLSSADERRHSMEVVERETRRLIQLVENVLRFSRASRGLDTLSIEAVALESVVRETIQAFEPLARGERATVVPGAGITGSGGSGAGGTVVRADENAVRRILLNLLDNAVKYGPRDQTVTVGLKSRAGRVILTVDDEGPGIPASERDRVWTAFSRLDREEEHAVAGSGVGLSIVRDLVERMGGTVRIDTAPGGGARFVVDLPAASPP